MSEKPSLTYFSPKVEKRKSNDRRPWPLCPGKHRLTRDRGGKGRVRPHPRTTRSGRQGAWSVGDPDYRRPVHWTNDEARAGRRHDPLNHSCEPNLGLQGQVVSVALRDIRAGKELTADYAMTDNEPYEMTCRCGRPSCRGTITGFDWRKPELQAKYTGYFSWFIQRRIDQVGEPASPHTGPGR